MQGGLGRLQRRPDRRDLAEALSLGRGAAVRGATGALGSWPAAPAGTTDLGQTVSLLGPQFEAPRTQRLALSLAAGHRRLDRVRQWGLPAHGLHDPPRRPQPPGGLDRRRPVRSPALRSPAAAWGAARGRTVLESSLRRLRCGACARCHRLLRLRRRVRRHRPRGGPGLSVAINYTHAATEDNLAARDSRGSPPSRRVSAAMTGPRVVRSERTASRSGRARMGAVHQRRVPARRALSRPVGHAVHAILRARRGREWRR
jgi:hypothetical protein